MSARNNRRPISASAGLEPHLEQPIRRTVGVPASCFLPGTVDDAERYGLTIEGTCLQPKINDGDLIVVSPRARISGGDFVVIWIAGHPRPLVKRIVGTVPKPYAPGSDVQPCMRAEQLNPYRTYLFPVDKIRAVHKVIGWTDPAKLVEPPAPKRKRRRK